MAELKPYLVTISRTLPVVAENERDAIDEALAAERDDCAEPEVSAVEVTESRKRYTGPEFLECIPYGVPDGDPDPDRMFQTYIKKGD